MLSVAMTQLSNDSEIHCVRLMLWTASCFHIMGPVGQNQAYMLCQVCQVAASGTKSAISDCSLLYLMSKILGNYAVGYFE